VALKGKKNKGDVETHVFGGGCQQLQFAAESLVIRDLRSDGVGLARGQSKKKSLIYSDERGGKGELDFA
jgi:hypothetical protein